MVSGLLQPSGQAVSSPPFGRYCENRKLYGNMRGLPGSLPPARFRFFAVYPRRSIAIGLKVALQSNLVDGDIDLRLDPAIDAWLCSDSSLRETALKWRVDGLVEFLG